MTLLTSTTLALATLVRVHYPAAATPLALRGAPPVLSWDQGVALTPVGNDTYEVSLDLAAGSTLEVKGLLADRDWQLGPNSLVVAGRTNDLYPRFQRERGQVVEPIPVLSSALLGRDVRITAYLPPSYDENTTARYPVLYMHDGQNLYDPPRAPSNLSWRLDAALDELYRSDMSMPEIIVIGVGHGGAARFDEMTPTAATIDGQVQGGRGPDYLNMIVTELKPRIDQLLRTKPERESTGILGSSLGGLISATAGLSHNQIFGRVAAMSPSSWWDDRWVVNAVRQSSGLSPRPVRVYLDCGTPGDGSEDTVLLADAYRAAGYDVGGAFRFVAVPGAQHHEGAWAARLGAALDFLWSE